MINADVSAGATVTNLGSSFLERLAKFRAAMQSHRGMVGVEFKW